MDYQAEDRLQWAVLAAVTLATLVGVALRVYHLEIPLRYDEAVTYFEHASESFAHAATSYSTPNNHIFNSLLVYGLTETLGSRPWVIRLPTFLAGCLLVPAVAWLALLRHGRRAAVVAAFLVACTPVLVEYSSNARGHTMVALLTVLGVIVSRRLLERPGTGSWFAWVAVGVVGHYTVPVMIIPWMGISLWLWVNLFVRGEGLRGTLASLAPLILAGLLVAVSIFALYAPVVRQNGFEALAGNRFVEPMDAEAFVRSLPGTFEEVVAHWGRGMPLALAALLGAGGALGLFLARDEDARDPGRFPLSWALLIGVAGLLVAQRNPGDPRIWLWALPLVLVGLSVGFVRLLERLARPGIVAVLNYAVVGLWAALLSVHLVVNRPLWRSLETGGFMEVEKVAGWLEKRIGPGDVVVTDFVSWEPLRFYLEVGGEREVSLPYRIGADGRVWVVVNRHEDRRVADVVRRARSLGLPLGTARPAETFGPVGIYGFGQRTQNPSVPETRGVDVPAIRYPEASTQSSQARFRRGLRASLEGRPSSSKKRFVTARASASSKP